MSTSTRQVSRWIAILGVSVLALTACAESVGGRAVAASGAVKTGSSSTGSSSTQSTVSDPPSSGSSSSGKPSSSSSESSSSPSKSSSSSSESSATTTSGSDSAPAPTGNETPPGTTLALTDPAVVPLEYAGESGIFEIKDLKVVQGTADDWAKLDVDAASVVGLAPWYISFTVTQVSGELNFAYSDFGYDIDGVTDQGRDLDLAIALGDGVGCESGYWKDGYAIGDSYTTCTVWQTDDRAKLVQLEFRGDYDGPYYDSPIVWTVG